MQSGVEPTEIDSCATHTNTLSSVNILPIT
jgi:hypothetical protein